MAAAAAIGNLPIRTERSPHAAELMQYKCY